MVLRRLEILCEIRDQAPLQQVVYLSWDGRQTVCKEERQTDAQYQ